MTRLNNVISFAMFIIMLFHLQSALLLHIILSKDHTCNQSTSKDYSFAISIWSCSSSSTEWSSIESKARQPDCQLSLHSLDIYKLPYYSHTSKQQKTLHQR